MTEDEAVLRCQDGDRDAFRYLVEWYKDVLYGTAFLMTGNRALAEDQVQEAFLSAWQGIRGFQHGRPFKPWLVRILVNAVLGQRRRRSLVTVPLEDSARSEASASTEESREESPQELLEASEDRQSVRSALAGLPPDQRQVVVLRYFADLTVRQVAQSMGIKEGTVKSRLHRSLRQLRSQLEEFGDRQVDSHGQ